MRKLFGLLVLLIGWIVLGLTGTGKIFTGFNFGKDAKEMETYVSEGAADQIGATTYQIDTQVSGRDIMVSGIAASEEEKATIIGNLDATHGRRVIVDDIKLINIASPYIFKGIKDITSTKYTGNAPTTDSLKAIIGDAATKMTPAGGMPDTSWPDFVGQGVNGLKGLKTGELSILDRTLSLKGTAASLEDEESVRSLFETLPDGYSADLNIDVEPTVPYVFNGKSTGAETTYQGYIPSESMSGTFAGLVGNDDATFSLRAGMPDDIWPAFVGMGIKGLKSLNEGDLKISDRTLMLSGTVNTPDAIGKVKEMFNPLPEGYSTKFDLRALDDGKPAVINFNWAAGEGGAVEGKAADGLELSDLSGALNLPQVEGALRVGMVDGKESILGRFAGIGTFLPKLESANAIVTSDKTVFNGVLLPGGDLESVKSGLVDSLGENAEISLVRSALEPKEGDERTNVDTGKLEVYRAGFWIPVPQEGDKRANPETGIMEIFAGGTWGPIPKPKPLPKEGDKRANPETGVMEIFAGGTWGPIPKPKPLPKEGDKRANPETGVMEIFAGGVWGPIPKPIEVAKPKKVEPPKPKLIDVCRSQVASELTGKKINFETSSAVLTAESRELISSLAPTLTKCIGIEGLSLEVGGHTDDRGAEEFNLNLSQERANSVRELIVELGVNPDNVISKGFGETQPIASNDTEEGLAANRRTTFTWSQK